MKFDLIFFHSGFSNHEIRWAKSHFRSRPPFCNIGVQVKRVSIKYNIYIYIYIYIYRRGSERMKIGAGNHTGAGAKVIKDAKV